MTAIQYVENVIENNWTSSISGRPHDVKPIDEIKVVYESDIDWRAIDLANYDYLTLSDGGIVDMEGQSFNWSEERILQRVSVDIRTRGWPGDNRPGRIALYGERGAGTLNANEAPRWGGLVGETLRVMKSVRKGDQEFDLVDADEADDLSGQMGGQVWRSIVNVTLDERASVIDTST